MTKSIIILAILMVSNISLAKNFKCKNEVIRQTVLHNTKGDVSTNSIGTRGLNSSNYLETYLVGTTDEVGPREYVVVAKKTDCSIQYIEIASDYEIEQEGLLDTISCWMDRTDKKPTCE